jgi:hypothetical protein
MLNSISVCPFGLRQSGGCCQRKQDNNQKPDKIPYHALTLRAKNSRKKINVPDKKGFFYILIL